MSELKQFVASIPPVTRVITLGSLATSGLTALGIVDVSHIVIVWTFILEKWQIWRLFTGFLVPHPQPMQGMMEIYMLYSFSRGLEENKFKYRLPDYIYYFMIVIPIILLATSWMKVYSLSGALLSSITLTWSLANYNSLVNFYFMSMKASLLPAVSIGFRLILDGKKSALVHVAGMFAGYIYNCLETKSFGPLAGMLLSMQGADTNVHPNRVGTLSSVNSQWFYATGDLPAPMWLKSLVTRLIGVNYTQAPRHGYHVINSGTVPATSPASAASSSGFLKNPFEKPAFKGKGQRLGSN